MAFTKALLGTGEALLALLLSTLLIAGYHPALPGLATRMGYAVLLSICALAIWKLLDLAFAGLQITRRRVLRFLADWELLLEEMTPVIVPSRTGRK